MRKMAEARGRKSLYVLGTEYESAAVTVASRIKRRRDRLKALSPHCKEAVSLREDIAALYRERRDALDTARFLKSYYGEDCDDNLH